ncbi:hypothetical protein OSTOST_05601 [Ostertagia ostertagi]
MNFFIFLISVYFEDETLSPYESDSFEDDDYIPYFDEALDKFSTPEKVFSSETVFAPSFRKRAYSESAAKVTCSLSDILDQTDFSQKRESAEPVYGANRVFITGEETKNPDDLRKLKNACCSTFAELGTNELLSDSIYETFLSDLIRGF